MLRPDSEIDFLAFSLADAITASLSGLESLVVRSSRAAGPLAEDDLDLSRLASEIGVDAVLFGTLLRSGDQVRLSTQLVEAPGGTLLCTHNAQVSIGDIFELQDDLTARVVESLAIPLSAREERLLHNDAPRTSRAYELYLRANNAASPMNATNLEIAGDLYRESLADDSQFAPAWARLGRVCRILAKYGHRDAEKLRAEAQQAFSKALELNPDLPLAHNYYTYFEVEELGDPVRAMRRLLAQAQTGSADPDLFVGLVVACRFCGLLEASLAAADRAHRLDPRVQTSVQYTYWQLGDYERCLEVDRGEARFVSTHVYATRGEIERLREVSRNIDTPDLGGELSRMPLAAAKGDREGCLRAYRIVRDSAFSDLEGFYLVARCLARVGEDDEALNLLERVVAGFVCDRGLEDDPWFADLRSDVRFQTLTQRAAEQHKANAEIFKTVGGPEILGI
jgi:TolB-like protein